METSQARVIAPGQGGGAATSVLGGGSARFMPSNAKETFLCVIVALVLAIGAALCEVVFSSNAFGMFMQSASQSINGQSFFMFGAIITGTLCVVFPQLIERHIRSVAVVGATAFTLAMAGGYFLQFSPSACQAFAPLVLAIWSCAYNFAKFPIIYLVIETRNYPFLVTCIALSRAFEMVMVSGVVVLGATQQLIVCFVSAPLCIILIAWFVGALKAMALSNPVAETKLVRNSFEMRDLIIQAIFISFATATLRILSPWGIYEGTEMHHISLLTCMLAAVFVPLASWLLFLRNQNTQIGRGFGPASLIILGGFFIVILNSFDVSFSTAQLASVLLLVLFNFGHVAFWNEVAAISWLVPGQTMRAVGAAMDVFSASVFLWIVMFQNIGSMAIMLIVLAGYLGVIAIWKVFPNVKKAPSEQPVTDESQRLQAYASEHGLSPRETEVFLLLAQGRSRRYIQEKMALSDGTVKTYASRVYQKLGVSGKQEMLAVLFDEQPDEG